MNYYKKMINSVSKYVFFKIINMILSKKFLIYYIISCILCSFVIEQEKKRRKSCLVSMTSDQEELRVPEEMNIKVTVANLHIETNPLLKTSPTKGPYREALGELIPN
jgi:hypothetical protein